MTCVFLYEYLTGGGLLGSTEALPASLWREGAAMISALAADFARLPDLQVELMVEPRASAVPLTGCRLHQVTSVEQERITFATLAARADWTVIIAPESHDALLTRCKSVVTDGGRLLGPNLEIVSLCGDKHRTAEHLRSAGVPAPFGMSLEPGILLPRDFPMPAVLKPRDGAGSDSVQCLSKPLSAATAPKIDRPSRLEQYCPGLAASVAWLCGPADKVPLTPCRQHLSEDGQFHYQGGSLPLDGKLAERAIAISRAAIDSLGVPLGYLGVDLVLGEQRDGAGDYVIEINPRLTTSYVGLRRAARTNLAGVMLDIARGRSASPLFSGLPVEFTCDGQVRMGCSVAEVAFR